MADLWVDLLPVLLAMMISPARTLAVIILLHTPKSTSTALGFVGGMGALFPVGGIILLVGAFKIAAAPASGGGSLASLLDRLEQVQTAGAYLIGFGWIFASPKQWVFVLTAVAVIFAADLRAVASLANFVVFTLLVQLAYFVIIGGFALAQERVGRILDAAFAWIRAHLRPTAVALFAGFGIVFLVKGISSLSRAERTVRDRVRCRAPPRRPGPGPRWTGGRSPVHTRSCRRVER